MTLPGHATKDTCLAVSEKEWSEIAKKTDYTETYSDNKKEEKKEKSWNMGRSTADLSLFKYLFYFGIAGVILFVIVKVLMNLNTPPVSVGNGINTVYSLAEVEEKIMEIDLDKILESALADKNYKLAFRIHFLILIKMLTKSGKISWTKEKTNWEYYQEIKDPSVATDFKQIVSVFELVWYGDHTLTESQYYGLQPSYENFKRKLI